MGKTTQKELLLQADMIKDLKSQGFYADKVSDRFKAGKHDLRIARSDTGQLDVELKYCEGVVWRYPLNQDLELAGQVDGPAEPWDTGMTKLQWLKLKEKNEHGIPAVCLIYYEAIDEFGITTLLRDTLPPPARRVTKLPRPGVIDGSILISTTMEYLHGLGYRYRLP